MIRKIILIILCGCAVSWSGLRIYQNFSEEDAPAFSHDPGPTLPAIDVDALAARHKKHQDIYQKVRDQSLTVFAKLHPKMPHNDPEIDTAIRLAAYLKIWGDYYMEDLNPLLDRYAKAVQQRYPDPMMKGVIQAYFYKSMMSSTDDFQGILIRDLEALEKSDYPPCFKFFLCRTLLIDCYIVKSQPKYRDAMPRSQSLYPEVSQRMTRWYRQMIQEKYPDDLLFSYGEEVLSYVRPKEEALNLFHDVLEKSFPENKSPSALRIALQGSYYTTYAWNARGGSWARDVSEESWKLFYQRLEKASEILEKGYTQYPQFNPISREMLTVELGLNRGREQFNLWFNRAIDADPDDFQTYASKQNYLLARWHGSDKEGYAFAMNCVEIGNWQCKIPMILTNVLADVSERNPKIYAHPEIWKQAHYVYSTYLEQHPRSTIYRSHFAKAAALGEHWQVAQEQFEKLGNDWDRHAFDKNEYETLRQTVKEHLDQSQPATAPAQP